jgi:hypothetical protein
LPCLAAALFAVGCGRESVSPAADAAPPTEEVAPAVDAALSTAADPQAKARAESFSGILPDGFPGDVPPYEPSTLADFGTGETGRRYVVFQTPDSPELARSRLERRLAAQGWSVARDGFTKGGRQLRVAIEPARPGARIRLEY